MSSPELRSLAPFQGVAPAGVAGKAEPAPAQPCLLLRTCCLSSALLSKVMAPPQGPTWGWTTQTGRGSPRKSTHLPVTLTPGPRCPLCQALWVFWN